MSENCSDACLLVLALLRKVKGLGSSSELEKAGRATCRQIGKI